MSDLIKDLRAQSLLEGLDDGELEKIAPRVRTVRVKKDDFVFTENSACEGIYMINAGKIEISKMTDDGWRQPLVMLKERQFMGEIALLKGTAHATDARAAEPSEFLLIPREDFDGLERTEPVIMLRIIKNIAIISGLNVRRMNDKFLKALVNY